MLRKLVIVLFFSFLFQFSHAQGNYSIENDSLTKYLVLYSNAIDAFPIWENNSTILVNIGSEGWTRCKLANIKPETNSTLEKTFGYDFDYKGEKVRDISIKNMDENSDLNPREIELKSGIKIAIEQVGFNSQCVITESNKRYVAMKMKGNSHSIAISPNGKYAAFIVEMSGLMVLEIENELKLAKQKEDFLSKMNSLEKGIYYYNLKLADSTEKYLFIAKGELKNNSLLNFYLGKHFFGTLDFHVLTRPDTILYYLNQVNDSKEFDDKYLIMAKMYEEKRDTEKTIYYADIAIEKTPNNPLPYYVKGLAYGERKDAKGVCENMGKACDLGDEYGCKVFQNCGNSSLRFDEIFKVGK